MKNSINEKILAKGTIRNATKLPVITIGLGKVKDLKPLDRIIWKDEDGNVLISTKENPEGILYDQDSTAVVRVIGGKVKMNGMYDLYVPAARKIEKLLGNPIVLSDQLDEAQLAELAPILGAASEVRPSLAPAEPGRKVVVVTKEMLEGAEYILCHCSYEPDPEATVRLYEGDIFLVEDTSTAAGYRIGKDEFAETHELL